MEEALCDILLLGLKEVNIQREMLKKKEDLTYATTIETALTLEVVRTVYDHLHENPVVDIVKTEYVNHVKHVKSKEKFGKAKCRNKSRR